MPGKAEVVIDGGPDHGAQFTLQLPVVLAVASAGVRSATGEVAYAKDGLCIAKTISSPRTFQRVQVDRDSMNNVLLG